VQRCAGGDAGLYVPDRPDGTRSPSLEALLRLLEGVQDRALGCVRNLLAAPDAAVAVADLDPAAGGTWQALWNALCGLVAQVWAVAGPARVLRLLTVS
jgi:hypothetical protein